MFNPLSSLESAIEKNNADKIEKSLYELNTNIKISDFVSLDSPVKPDFLRSILKKVLPLISHEDLKLRLHAESFLLHWSFLLSGFAPNLLRTVYESLDTSTLQPSAYSIVFTCWTNSLRSVPPNQRVQLIGTCHSLLLSSHPKQLTNVTREIWKLIRDTLENESIKSIIVYLLDSPLPSVVSYLCQKSPDYFFPVVCKRSSIQFIKDTIQHWPNNRPIDLSPLVDRFKDILGSQNSSDISTTLEIISIYLKRLKPGGFVPEFLPSVLNGIDCNFSRYNISQQSACIEIFGLCATLGLCKSDSLERFIAFDNVPSPLLISVLKVVPFFVNRSLIPLGFFDVMEKIAYERDPLLYLAELECLGESFDSLYIYDSEKTVTVLNYSLNPIPKYFVEKVQVIKLLRKIKVERYPKNIIKEGLLETLLRILSDPHPSVVKELVVFLKDSSVTIPYTNLNWFDHSEALIKIFQDSDPTFIIELIDSGFISPSVFPIAAKSIVKSYKTLEISDKKLSNMLFSRALSILIVSMKCLGFDSASLFQTLSVISSYAWKDLCDYLPDLLSSIDGPLLKSTYGKIVNRALEIVCVTLPNIDLEPKCVLGLVGLSKVLSIAFTPLCCSLVIICTKFYRSNGLYSFHSLRSKFEDLLDQFFICSFPFDFAESVSKAAYECLPKERIEILIQYLLVSADFSRECLIKFSSLGIEGNCPFRTFLAFKNDPTKAEYIEDCIHHFPFHDWIIDVDDFEYISLRKGISIGSYHSLSPLHIELTQKFPASFIFSSLERKEISEIIFAPSCFPSYSPVRFNSSKESVSKKMNISFPVPYPFDNEYRMITFLWHSERDLPKGAKWNEIESYVIDCWSNSKLVCSFLAYSIRKNLSFSNDQIYQQIVISRDDQYSLYSVYLLLTRLTEIDKKEQFISKIMIELGISFENLSNMIYIALYESSIISMITYKILILSPDYLEAIGIDRTLLFDDHTFMNAIPAYLNENDPSPESLAFIIKRLSQLAFSVSSDICSYDIPSHCGLDSLIRIQCCVSSTQRRLRLDQKILDSLVSFALKEEKQYEIIIYIIDMCLYDENKNSIILNMFSTISKVRPYSFLSQLNHLSSIKGSYQKLSEGYGDKLSKLISTLEVSPPSTSRYLLKILMNNSFALEPKDLQKIIFKMKPIIYEFLYSGFHNIRSDIVDQRFPDTYDQFIETRTFSRRSSQIIKKTLINCESKVVTICKRLFALPDSVLVLFYNSPNIDTAKLSILQDIIVLLAHNFNYLTSVIDLMHFLLTVSKLDQLILFILTKETLNGPKLSNIIIAYNMLKTAIQNSDDTNAKELFVDFEKNIVNMIEDPNRIEIFKSCRFIEYISGD